MKYAPFYILLLISFSIQAQIQHGGFPVGLSDVLVKSTRSSKPILVEMPAFEIPTSDTLSEDNRNKTLTFAHPFEVHLSPENSGRWITLNNGNKMWQLTIRSKDAASINLIFHKFKLPKGGKVFLYNPEMTHVVGAFTEKNTKASGILPTLPVYGDEIVVEYQEPEHPECNAELVIGQVNHDYTDIFNRLKVGYFGDSKSCEKNVTCYTDDLYEKTRRSTVKLIINGSELMSGTLVNNTKQDGTPYIITAAHGFEDHSYSADKTLFVFNYEVPLCFNNLEGTREQSIAGGTILAYSPKVNGEALDFALVEMSVKPPTAYRAYYAGWNRSTVSPSHSFCIHHPMGDVKKISFDDDALLKKTLSTNSIAYYPAGHWNVIQWDEGVTEGGSSGSGLFNPQGQLIGALSAGSASCNNPRNDYFYRFDLAWNTFSASNRQLAHWLDKDNTNLQELAPFEPTAVVATQRLTHINDNSDVTIAKDNTIGNIAGNNTIGMTHFVEKFESNSEKQILGFYFVAAEGKPSSIVNTSIWTGSDKPEQEVYNEALLVKQWVYTTYSPTVGSIGGFYPKDSLDMQENFVFFSSPISVSGNYFIGFEVNNTESSPPFGLVLSHTNSDDNAFYYDTQWHSYLDLADYNKATTLWIDPVVQSDYTSTLETKTALALKVYPNPVKTGERLNIETSTPSDCKIAIYNLLGQHYSVLSEQQNDSTISINVDKLSSGTYILQANQQQTIFTKK